MKYYIVNAGSDLVLYIEDAKQDQLTRLDCNYLCFHESYSLIEDEYNVEFRLPENVTEIDEQTFLNLVSRFTDKYAKEKDRQALIELFSDNDRNGIYDDESSLDEYGCIMSLDDCLEYLKSNEELHSLPQFQFYLNKYSL